MAFIHYATKRAARRAQRVFFLGAAQFGVLTEILGAVPHAIVGRASIGAIATAMGYLGTEAGHAAEDPPRPDFRTPTRSKRRRLPLEDVGDSPLERQTAVFATEASFGAAYLSAFVRAVERSQSAEEFNVRDVIADRLAEADLYAHRAAISLRRTSERDVSLIRTLETDGRFRRDVQEQFQGPRGQELIDTPFWEKIPPEILKLFHEARFEPQLRHALLQPVSRPLHVPRHDAEVLGGNVRRFDRHASRRHDAPSEVRVREVAKSVLSTFAPASTPTPSSYRTLSKTSSAPRKGKAGVTARQS